MPLRVLIVDDNRVFLEAACGLLERQQLEVVGRAANSQEALSCTRETNPDVVLVDVSLGRESGLELTHLLAGDANGGPVPVILISTRSEEDLADLIDGCPVLGFIPKAELSAAAVERLVSRPAG